MRVQGNWIVIEWGQPRGQGSPREKPPTNDPGAGWTVARRDWFYCLNSIVASDWSFALRAEFSRSGLFVSTTIERLLYNCFFVITSVLFKIESLYEQNTSIENGAQIAVLSNNVDHKSFSAVRRQQQQVHNWESTKDYRTRQVVVAFQEHLCHGFSLLCLAASLGSLIAASRLLEYPWDQGKQPRTCNWSRCGCAKRDLADISSRRF